MKFLNPELILHIAHGSNAEAEKSTYTSFKALPAIKSGLQKLMQENFAKMQHGKIVEKSATHISCSNIEINGLTRNFRPIYAQQ